VSQTLAQNANQVLAECGFLAPDSYFGNQDQNVLQIVALAQAVALESVEEKWQQLTKISTLSLTSSQTYPLPSDFLSFTPDTMYQQGRFDSVDLPTEPEVWALLTSVASVASLPVRARIYGGQLHILNPQSGATITYEYNSNAPITDATGATAKTQFTADTDIWLLDDRMFQLELKWRFKKEKGLDFTADLQNASNRRASVRSRENPGQVIALPRLMWRKEPYADLWAHS
jgi:hypothetical protein